MRDNSVRDNSVRDNSVRDNSVRDNTVRDNTVRDNSVSGRRQRFNRFDRLMRRLRARSLVTLIPAGSSVIDVGCGQENWLVRSMDDWAESSIGIDPDLDEELLGPRGSRLAIDQLAEQCPRAFDAATSMAVIEHLPVDRVGGHLAAIASALRPDGRLVLTTPTRWAKPVLEFMAFRLKIISQHEIRDHRHYWSRAELLELLGNGGWRAIEHRYFQLGFNQRVVATAPSATVRPAGDGTQVAGSTSG